MASNVTLGRQILVVLTNFCFLADFVDFLDAFMNEETLQSNEKILKLMAHFLTYHKKLYQELRKQTVLFDKLFCTNEVVEYFPKQQHFNFIET